MRIAIVAVGRLKEAADRVLAERYAARATAAGRALSLGPVTVTEIREGTERSAGERMETEARRLLAASAGAEVRVALDVRGTGRSSAAFAERIRAERDRGRGSLVFLIGGPDGLGEAALAASSERLSLGPMTLPHALARIVLLEQIYRATAILGGHPYHRA